MKSLCAGDALSTAVIHVSSESRPGDVRKQVACNGATHAIVFDDVHFRGIVSLREIGFSRSERIFADLIPSKPVCTVQNDALIDEVGKLIDAGVSDVLIVTAADERFLGIITQQSLLTALLRQSEARKDEGIKAAEERFRGLLESAPDAMLVVDRSGCVVQANKQAAAMFGFTPPDILGLVIEQLLPKNAAQNHARHRRTFFDNPAQRLMARGKELVARRKDGTEFPVAITLAPVAGDTGTSAIAAIRDMTDVKAAEESIRRARDFYLTLLDDFPLLVWRSGLDAQCNYFNRTWLNFTGRTVEQELGEGWVQGVHPDDANCCVTSYLAAFQARKEFTIEYRLRRADGEYRWIVDWGRPIYDLDGAFSGYIGAAQDITDRVRSEQKLRDSEERFRQLAQNIPEIFWVVNLGAGQGDDCTVAYVSPAYEKVWGMSCESLYRNSKSYLYPIHPDDLPHVAALTEKSRAGTPCEIEYRIARQGGDIRWILDRAFPIRDDSGRVHRLVGVASDITERKNAADALNESNRKLEAAMRELTRTQEQVVKQERLRAVGEMASGIAHDLNNSLSPVLGYAEIVAASPDLPERLRALVQMVQTAALDAAAVVQRLSDFYRPDALGTPATRVALTDLVRQIPLLTRPKWRDEAQKLGRKIEFHLDAGADIAVFGNSSELREVLANLVFNAVDAMPAGGTITLRLRDDGESAVIEVCDTGVGMTEDIARRCFEPFFSTKGPQGSGLGLSICHGIVERHGGRLDIDTRPGIGTTMRLRLPRAKACAAPLEHPPPAETHPALRRKLLYIDDDPRLRQLVGMLLQELGQEVELAGSGAEGLSLFHAKQYDAVITDWGMPDIDGREVTRIVKTLRPGMPVIMVSGWNAGALIEGNLPGFLPDETVSKPVTLDKLRAVLDRIPPIAGLSS